MENANFLYAVNDKPPLSVQIMQGLQHCMGIASTLALPLIIFASAHLSLANETHLIAASLFTVGIGTILMALNTRFLGTGFLCPLLCEPAFLVVSLVAVKLGGAPLLFGMTLIAGLFQCFFSFCYPYIRRFFSTEVSGVVVLMVGFSLIKPDLAYSSASKTMNMISWNQPDLITAAISLMTMLILAIWNWGKISNYSLLVGIIVGFFVAKWQGILTDATINKVIHAPLLAWPTPFTLPEMKFNFDLILPFAIASIAMTLKGIGGIINCQKTAFPDWIRPDQHIIRKGIFTNSIAIMISSICGGIGLGVANNCIGLAAASKVISRYVAITTGILLIIFAFIPKIALFFVIIPKPVMGAALIFVTCYVIISGIQIITVRTLNTRKIFVVGLSLMVGLSLQIFPEDLTNFSPILRPIFSSSIVMTTLVAILLNMITTIRITQKSTLILDDPKDKDEKIKLYMVAKGKEWDALPYIIHDATAILRASISELAIQGVKAPIKIEFCYDDYCLKVALIYPGPVLNLHLDENGPTELDTAIKIVKTSMPELSINHERDDKTQENKITFKFLQ